MSTEAARLERMLAGTREELARASGDPRTVASAEKEIAYLEGLLEAERRKEEP